MRPIGLLEQLLVLSSAAVVAAACGGPSQPSGDTAPERDLDPGKLERAYVACFEDHGVDARIMEGGGIHFDSGGILSFEASQELIETCRQQLDAMGLIDEPDRDEDWLVARHAELLSLRDCLLNLGYSAPEVPSLEVYLEDPSAGTYPYDHIFADPRLSGEDIRAIVDVCPDPGGRLIISD